MAINKDDVVKVLNEIVELELAGAVRYTQYWHASIGMVSTLAALHLGQVSVD